MLLNQKLSISSQWVSKHQANSKLYMHFFVLYSFCFSLIFYPIKTSYLLLYFAVFWTLENGDCLLQEIFVCKLSPLIILNNCIWKNIILLWQYFVNSWFECIFLGSIRISSRHFRITQAWKPFSFYVFKWEPRYSTRSFESDCWALKLLFWHLWSLANTDLN